MNARFDHYRSNPGFSPAGSGIRPCFRKKVDPETGSPKLVQVGETDQHALIQSFREEVDINRLVARYEAGDIRALSRVQGLYYDASAMPDNPVEALNLGVMARQAWDSLSPEDRARYENLGGYLDAISAIDNPAPADPVQDPITDLAPEGGTV